MEWLSAREFVNHNLCLVTFISVHIFTSESCMALICPPQHNHHTTQNVTIHRHHEDRHMIHKELLKLSARRPSQTTDWPLGTLLEALQHTTPLWGFLLAASGYTATDTPGTHTPSQWKLQNCTCFAPNSCVTWQKNVARQQIINYSNIRPIKASLSLSVKSDTQILIQNVTSY